MNVPVTRRLREQIIASGFNVLNATGLHRAIAPLTQGRGAILMFHHVRPWRGDEFAPNRLLEITPQFFDTVLTTVRDSGFDIVTLDDAVARLSHAGRRSDKPFVVITFDDGYRDNRDYALPIMRRHNAPFTMFVTSGFADRTARLWWVELEEAIRAQPKISVRIDKILIEKPARTPDEKQAAFNEIYWMLRGGAEERLLAVIADMCGQAGIEPAAIATGLCMDWEELRGVAADPLCTIGVHTVTHPMLAKHDDAFARREIVECRDAIESHLGVKARHLAYPVGGPGSAGARDFALAAELDFASGVTTRPGMLFSEHGAHLMALPRLSVNGNWQDRRYLEVLLSGAPFALWNRGRKLNVA